MLRGKAPRPLSIIDRHRNDVPPVSIPKLIGSCRNGQPSAGKHHLPNIQDGRAALTRLNVSGPAFILRPYDNRGIRLITLGPKKLTDTVPRNVDHRAPKSELNISRSRKYSALIRRLIWG